MFPIHESFLEWQSVASSVEVLKDLFFEVTFETNPLVFGGRVLLFVLMIVWGVVLISASIESI